MLDAKTKTTDDSIGNIKSKKQTRLIVTLLEKLVNTLFLMINSCTHITNE